MATVYKIRDKATGLFSTGGYNPTFEKKGKEWKALQHVRSHLTQLSASWIGPKKAIPPSWEIVEYEVVKTEVGVLPALPYRKERTR
jgi:hypothetical protein